MERGGHSSQRTPHKRLQGQGDSTTILSEKRLFEEDELSDDEGLSLRSGAEVLRRARALGK